jgi:response regulator of citrate/malate metabolism
MKCEFCQSNNDIQTHHIKPTIVGGDDDEYNKINLCHRCHRLVHKLGIYDKSMVRDIKKYGIAYYFINGFAQKELDRAYDDFEKLDYNLLILFCNYMLNEVAYSKSKHSELIKLGMNNAKINGKQFGRPQTELKDIPTDIIKTYKLLINKEINKTEYARICNVSRPSLDKYLKILDKGGNEQ